MKMLKNIVTLLTLGWSVAVFAQSETRDLPAFTKVNVSEGIEVVMSKGDAEKAKIEVDNIDIDEVLTEVSGGTLRISLDGFNHRNVDVKIYLSYVNLSALKASSAAEIKVLDLVKTSGDFELDVSSAGDIELNLEANEVEIDASSAGDIKLGVVANKVEADISSAGEVEIEGRTGELEAEASSSGELVGGDLICGSAEVRASSGGSIKIHVKDRLEARASSGGIIKYLGNPKNIDKDTSSGGSVRAY